MRDSKRTLSFHLLVIRKTPTGKKTRNKEKPTITLMCAIVILRLSRLMIVYARKPKAIKARISRISPTMTLVNMC